MASKNVPPISSVEKELQEIRTKLVPYAQDIGIYTDEDMERVLSR